MASTFSLFLTKNEEGKWVQLKTYVPVIEGSWDSPEEAANAIMQQAPSVFVDTRTKMVEKLDKTENEYALVHLPVNEQSMGLFHSFDLIKPDRKAQLIDLAKRLNGVPAAASLEMIPPPKPCEMQFYQKVLTQDGRKEESAKLWGEPIKEQTDNGTESGN